MGMLDLLDLLILSWTSEIHCSHIRSEEVLVGSGSRKEEQGYSILRNALKSVSCVEGEENKRE